MKRISGAFCAVALILVQLSAAHANWKPVEEIKTYAVSGLSGAQLYASIGEKGPKLAGGSRTIAHTNFKLTWTRNYVPERGGCTLKTARPKLIITYTLPKPASKLSLSVQKNWDRFSAGISAHERVHGEMILDLVHKIEAFTVGLRVENDPQCKKIREVMNARLSELSQDQRAQSREFDRVEMSDGGPVHRLILELLNGD